MRALPDPTQYKPLSELDPELERLDTVLKKALAPAPQRYGATQEFRDALLGCLGEESA